MKTILHWIFIPICTLFLCMSAHASTGTYSMSFVELISTTKAEALSNCVTALAKKEAIFVNPSAISANKNFMLSAQLFNYVEGIQYKQFRIIKPLGAGNIALSYTFLDYGKDYITTISDKQGGSSGSIENKSESLHLTYAKTIKKFNVGISTKYIQDKLYSYKADQIALDIGVQYFLNSSFSIGASSTNISLTKAKYLTETAHMRRIDRLGIHYKPQIFNRNISFLVDIMSLNGDSLEFALGSSFRLHKKLSVFLGKQSMADLYDVSLGVSYHSNAFELDFSYKPNNIFENTYRVGLTVGI